MPIVMRPASTAPHLSTVSKRKKLYGKTDNSTTKYPRVSNTLPFFKESQNYVSEGLLI
jgi:hypothetical protein